MQFKDTENPTVKEKTMVIEDVKREEASLDESGLLPNCA